MSERLFTSESVSEGHPDKVCDQISDSILDAAIEQDKSSRVACEVLVKDNLVVVAGEITTNALIDYESLAKSVISDIGYNDSSMQFNSENCSVVNAIGLQSKDIAQGVDQNSNIEQGAGDQGLMFGYATNETNVFMPAPINFSHLLVKKLSELRKNKVVDWLRPDSKSQVTINYSANKVKSIDTIVVSTQHSPDVSQTQITEFVKEEVVNSVIPKNLINKNTKFYINPTGNFEIGGPEGDCGLTGRKIIVDTYGGMARHGGGAFSGKDPSKVDRSAAYAARYVAKNLVAAGVAEKCEIQISYAIGVARPTSISVDTFGTSASSEEKIVKIINDVFDLTPWGIISMLDLLNPLYRPTAAYGHFGRDDIDLPWEKTDKIDAIKSLL